jgi:ribosomal protein L33
VLRERAGRTVTHNELLSRALHAAAGLAHTPSGWPRLARAIWLHHITAFRLLAGVCSAAAETPLDPLWALTLASASCRSPTRVTAEAQVHPDPARQLRGHRVSAATVARCVTRCAPTRADCELCLSPVAPCSPRPCLVARHRPVACSYFYATTKNPTNVQHKLALMKVRGGDCAPCVGTHRRAPGRRTPAGARAHPPPSAPTQSPLPPASCVPQFDPVVRQHVLFNEAKMPKGRGGRRAGK